MRSELKYGPTRGVIEGGQLSAYFERAVNPRSQPTIASLITDAAPGATIVIPPGVYRESVNLNKAVTLIADTVGTAYISGADVWGDDYWARPSTSYGARCWVSRLTVPSLATSGHGSDWAKSQYAVWFDGEPLVQIGDQNHPRLPGPGQFSIDNFGRILLGDSPLGHLVEVSTRANALTFNADATVSGLTFLHGASSDTGTVSPFPSVNFNSRLVTFTNNMVVHNKGIGIGGNIKAGSVITDNELAYNGVIGADLSSSTGISGAKGWVPTYFQRNKLHHNNTLGESVVAWTGGGLKFTSFDGLVATDNTAWSNNGMGIWGDISNTQATIQRNKCWFNEVAGIYFEVSGIDSAGFVGTASDISDNDTWENGWTSYAPNAATYGGIVISTSRNVNVHNNRCAFNAQAIPVWWDAARTDKPHGNENVADNIAVYDNDVVQETSFANNSIWSLAGSITFRDNADSALAPLYAAANGVGGRLNRITPYTAEASNFYAWGGGYQSTLAAFNATRGGNDGGGNSTAPSLAAAQAVLAAHGMPTTPLAGHGVASFGSFNSEQRPYPRYVTAAGTTVLDVWDRVVTVDCTAGNITLTLPNASAYAQALLQQPITIFRIDASANTLTVQPPSGQIDGAASITIAANGAKDVYAMRSGTTHTYRSK